MTRCLPVAPAQAEVRQALDALGNIHQPIGRLCSGKNSSLGNGAQYFAFDNYFIRFLKA